MTALAGSIQLLRNTNANLTAMGSPFIPLNGQMVIISDQQKFCFGDGATAYTALHKMPISELTLADILAIGNSVGPNLIESSGGSATLQLDDAIIELFLDGGAVSGNLSILLARADFAHSLLAQMMSGNGRVIVEAGIGAKIYSAAGNVYMFCDEVNLKNILDAINGNELWGGIYDMSGTASRILATDSNKKITGAYEMDTDGSLTANSDSRIASQKAVKTAIANAVVGLFDLKGDTDASTNPNYPAAEKGDAYIITVGGKIGGASGKSVDAGDVVIAKADNAGGDEATVGTSWITMEHNLVGALLATNNLSDISNAATARTNLGLGNVDNTSDSTKNSATATLTNKTYRTVETLIPASDIDWAAGNQFRETLAANKTYTFSNDSNGQTIVVVLTQDSTPRTVTWPTVKWAGGVAPVMSTGSGKIDIYTFVKSNGTIYGSVVQNMS